MKNSIKLIEAIRSIAVITIVVLTVLAMTACVSLGSSGISESSTARAATAPVPEPAPELGLFLTDLDEWNGYYITGDGHPLYAFSHFNEEGQQIGALITNGTVRLNVYEWDETTREYSTTPYTGSDFLEFYIGISKDDWVYHHFQYEVEYPINVMFFDGVGSKSPGM